MLANSFTEVLIEKVCREKPLTIEIVSPKMMGDDCISLQDLIKVTRILQAWKCNNDLVFPADLALPITIELNGQLLQHEVGGQKVYSHQMRALYDICDAGYEVTAYFGDEDTCYALGEGMTVLQILSRGKASL